MIDFPEMSEFCRVRGLAELTFGRRAVNDGKLANRLRNGGWITTDTLERIRAFMARNSDGAPARRRVLFEPTASGVLPVVKPAAPPVASGPRLMTRSGISVSSTTGRNICCS